MQWAHPSLFMSYTHITVLFKHHVKSTMIFTAWLWLGSLPLLTKWLGNCRCSIHCFDLLAEDSQKHFSRTVKSTRTPIVNILSRSERNIKERCRTPRAFLSSYKQRHKASRHRIPDTNLNNSTRPKHFIKSINLSQENLNNQLIPVRPCAKDTPYAS